MPELIPFKSYCYAEGKDSDKLTELIAPPYDVIAEEEQIQLKKNPNNICHVILPETYNAAKHKMDELISKGILKCDDVPCLYIYGIDYINPDTEQKMSRYGFVGLLELVEIFPADDGVIPHEMTFKKYIEDRLQIIRKTDGNFSPLFLIYNGDEGETAKIFNKYVVEEPALKAMDRDGFTHKIWKISAQGDIKALQDIVKTHSTIIADGHHRYNTCLQHSREGGAKHVMCLMIDFNDPGLIIYTTHREVTNLAAKTIEEFKEKVKDSFVVEVLDHFRTLKDLMEFNKGKHVFGVYFQKKYMYLRLKKSIFPRGVISGTHSNEWKDLNIPILNQVLLQDSLNVKKEDINFIKDVKQGLKKVKEGKIDALFLLNPTTLAEIQTITRLKEIMPRKSTYFYPKPLSGLVIHKHSENIE